MKTFMGGVAIAAMMLGAPALAKAPPPTPEAGPDGAHKGWARPDFKPVTKAEFVSRVDAAFAAADLNHDGAVTRGELVDFHDAKMRERRKEHRDREFAALDANHDGMLTRAEFETAPPHGMMPSPPGGPDGAGAPPPPPGDGMRGPGGPGRMHHGMHGPMGDGMMPLGGRMFERADADHDGKVTLAEARTAATAMFDRIDTNHDGTISADEHMAAMRMMMGRRISDRPGRPGGAEGDGPLLPPHGWNM